MNGGGRRPRGKVLLFNLSPRQKDIEGNTESRDQVLKYHNRDTNLGATPVQFVYR